MKKAGIILIALQLFSYFGAIAEGSFLEMFDFSHPIHDVPYFFGSNCLGIIGIVLLVVGIVSKPKKAEKDEQDTGNAAEQ